MGKSYGIISIKGGVGKTTTVANLGAILSKVYNKKTLIVDANFSAPNLGIHLGIVSPDKTIHDVLGGKCKIHDAVYETSYGFDFIPGLLRGSGKIKHMALKKHLDQIKDDYDVILIDSSPNLNHEMLGTILASDSLLAVTTPDYATLSCTMHAVKIAKGKKTPILGMILNRVYNKKFELTLKEIEDASETPVLALLPHDIKVVESISKTSPAALTAPKSEAVAEYSKLAGVLVGEKYKDPRFFAQIKSIFSRVPKQELNRRELLPIEEPKLVPPNEVLTPEPPKIVKESKVKKDSRSY